MDEGNVTSTESSPAVQLWDPRRVLRRVGRHEARFSRGFLRCRPEKWFPGFAAHWLPLTHALGCEARISEVRPASVIPGGLEVAFVGSVDEESVLIALEQDSVRTITEEVVPGGGPQGAKVVLEYLMRRVLASLALSWSGPESSRVQFERDIDPATVQVVAAIKVTAVINTISCSVWIGLGERMCSRLDGLWRRQVQSSARVPAGGAEVHLELAQLGVPPQMLADYLKRETVIDLEVKASDSITLRLGSRPWMPARLIDVEGRFGCEMAPGALATPTVPEGTTRLSVELGTIKLDAATMAELGQSGAILLSEIPVSERVSLVINEDKVAEARLCVYEGRFAIEVQ